MNKHEKEDLIRALWKRYGAKHQLMKAVEELSELQKELMKALGLMESGQQFPKELLRNIAEEKEDVKFMMEQLDLMYVEPVYLSMNEKLNKLAAMLKEEAPVKEEKSIEQSMREFFENRYKGEKSGKKFWDDLEELSRPVKPHFPTAEEIEEAIYEGRVSKSMGVDTKPAHKTEIGGYWVMIDPQMPSSMVREIEAVLVFNNVGEKK